MQFEPVWIIPGFTRQKIIGSGYHGPMPPLPHQIGLGPRRVLRGPVLGALMGIERKVMPVDHAGIGGVWILVGGHEIQVLERQIGEPRDVPVTPERRARIAVAVGGGDQVIIRVHTAHMIRQGRVPFRGVVVEVHWDRGSPDIG